MTLIILGIAGLTLGGGSGWLTGQYGHAIDNLLSVRMVIASGDVVTASEEENSDLFWGSGAAGVTLVLSQNSHIEPMSRGPCSCKPS
jgi:FAD/FMN-containing dehydrogenase